MEIREILKHAEKIEYFAKRVASAMSDHIDRREIKNNIDYWSGKYSAYIDALENVYSDTSEELFVDMLNRYYKEVMDEKMQEIGC